jgi:hypothetical protein
MSTGQGEMMARDLTYEPENTVKSTALQRMPQRGEVIPFPEGSSEPVAMRDSTFVNMATKRVTKAQQKILMKAANPKTEIEILPSGEIYPPQIAMRRRLADAFGPMGWAIRPISEIPRPEKKDTRDAEILYREWALIAEGRVIATAIGSGKYYGSNARMDYSDVAESLKSDALKRCCKDLGVLWECWDPNFAEAWKQKYAVHVFVRVRDRKDKTKITQEARWRRIDRKPATWKLADEIEPVADSPNIDAWIKQRQEWTALIDRDTERIKVINEQYRSARKRNLEARQESESIGVNPDSTLPAIDVQPVREPNPPVADRKPETSHVGSRPSVTHSPRAVNTDDKPFMIRNCEIVVRDPKFTLHKITMMNGDIYWTFDTRVYAEMQKHFAARDKIAVQWESKKVKGENRKHIVEWQVKSQGRMEQ